MRRKLLTTFLALVLMLILATGTLAMSSANYQISWMVPLSGGGGAASSTNYAMKLTVGQTVVQKSTSAGYAAVLGFWSLGEQDTPIFMPLIKC